MHHGLIKTAAATPIVRVADCKHNTAEIIRVMNDAHKEGVRVLVLPELCVTGYTCGDLFFQKKLLDSAICALGEIVTATDGLDLLLFVGVPISVNGALYNCAAACANGKLLGVVPKTHLPNYSEFNEVRWFAPAPEKVQMISPLGYDVPFGAEILFECNQISELCAAAEICEDFWFASPPSVGHALAGATVIANLSASDEFVGKAAYRKMLVQSLSARLNCGYVYASAGSGESTTDVVCSAHNMICEGGVFLAESKLFTNDSAISEIDVFKLDTERRRLNTFIASKDGYTTVKFDLPITETHLTRRVEAKPFVPADKDELNNRCETVLSIQSHGLTARLKHAGMKSAVVSLSGGLDSTLALLVAVRAAELAGLTRDNVTAISQPCFGTSERTRNNAQTLARELGVSFREIDISNTVRSHLSDIGHDGSPKGAAYENAQARERMQVAMDVANMVGGLVVGSGDLSELALGWTTYNGDHMSMYGVNASVPKTMIPSIIMYEAERIGSDILTAILRDICDTPISPELLPPDSGAIAQKTEELVGPYVLNDFFLYNAIRRAFTPSKVLRLTEAAFTDYTRDEILKWLRLFYTRFFSNQFKRSCLPDGPKVGSVSLSPRGDWSMPSDAAMQIWLDEVNSL